MMLKKTPPNYSLGTFSIKIFHAFCHTLTHNLLAVCLFCRLTQIRVKHAGNRSKTLHQRVKQNQYHADGDQSLNGISDLPSDRRILISNACLQHTACRSNTNTQHAAQPSLLASIMCQKLYWIRLKRLRKGSSKGYMFLSSRHGPNGEALSPGQ